MQESNPYPLNSYRTLMLQKPVFCRKRRKRTWSTNCKKDIRSRKRKGVKSCLDWNEKDYYNTSTFSVFQPYCQRHIHHQIAIHIRYRMTWQSCFVEKYMHDMWWIRKATVAPIHIVCVSVSLVALLYFGRLLIGITKFYRIRHFSNLSCLPKPLKMW